MGIWFPTSRKCIKGKELEYKAAAKFHAPSFKLANIALELAQLRLPCQKQALVADEATYEKREPRLQLV
jgi:hypothetical protein